MSSSPARRGGKSAASLRLSFVLATLLTSLLAACAAETAAAYAAPPVAPPLPPPGGDVVTVGTVAELQAAVAALASGTTILIRPGTYRLTQELRIRNGVTNVALRGATNNRNDVVIKGSGMEVPGVNICIKCENAQGVLIANLSVGEVLWHPIQLQGEQGCDRVRLYNLRLFDAGEQFVKGTVDFQNPNGVDDGIVEYSVIEYTNIGPSHGYTQGVDIHYGANWIIRYNLFKNIRVPLDAPEYLGPAVLMWSGSRNTVCDSNTFIDCERAIVYGLGPQPGFPHGHEGGVICNNFIYRIVSPRVDAGISVWDSPNTKVLHNTVIQNGTYPDAIEYRFPGTTGVVIKNNLTDGAIRQRDGAQAELAGNLTTATPQMFVNPSIGDLHLLATATAAIDRGVNLTDCPTDWDGDPRPIGPARDIGADEHGFLDVPPSHPFYDFITTIARHGITSGCGGGNFCPDSSTSRDQMAIFLLRGKHGGSYLPPPATGSIFNDVPATAFAADWIERLYAEGITSGCSVSPPLYCPGQVVTRAQMAVFLLRAKHGSGYSPPPATGIFADVSLTDPFAPWIEQLFREGITAGCGGGNFCPNDPNTRGQMAVFLVRAFNLQ